MPICGVKWVSREELLKLYPLKPSTKSSPTSENCLWMHDPFTGEIMNASCEKCGFNRPCKYRGVDNALLCAPCWSDVLKAIWGDKDVG